MQVQLNHWLTLSIHHGDITEIRTDGIINPSNERLSLTNGISAKLLEKGGR